MASRKGVGAIRDNGRNDVRFDIDVVPGIVRGRAGAAAEASTARAGRLVDLAFGATMGGLLGAGAAALLAMAGLFLLGAPSGTAAAAMPVGGLMLGTLLGPLALPARRQPAA
jgi:hypothetical protein